jgi:pimeloyl-ACP methyl ester carboxylesterase
MNIVKYLLFITLLINSDVTFSQNIKRKASQGIVTEALNDSVVAANNLYCSEGLLVKRMQDEYLACKSGISVGDVLLKADSVLLKKPFDLYLFLNGRKEKDLIEIEFLSGKKKKTTKFELPGLSYEKDEDHEILYDEFAFGNGWIRTITDLPTNANIKSPAILFVQGYSCFSMDKIGKHPYGQLVKGLVNKGYVVMRVEKPGEGDNTNTTPCDEIDFHTEIDVFAKSLEKLKTYSFVDTSNIIIWGHSMGGIIAPVIAAGKNVKGIIVYGTGIKPWREYLVEMFRVQNPLYGVDYVENEANMMHFYNIIHQLFIEKKSPDEIASNQIYGKLMQDFMSYGPPDKIFARNYKYLVQIDDYNLPDYWSKTDSWVLSMWGDCDAEAYSDYDQKEIVDVVNHYHPDKAKFLIIKNTTHAFSLVNSMKHGIENYNYQYMIDHFNPAVVDESDKWIKSILLK